MCGIVGYVGPRAATPLLIEGLKRLEYRGYDSAGVAVMNGKGVETRKAAGKIARLESALGDGARRTARWASPTRAGRRTGRRRPATRTRTLTRKSTVAVVHNGIIENARRCGRCSRRRGYMFTSDTDTEVLAHLIESAYDGCLEDAVHRGAAPGRGHVRHRRRCTSAEPDKIVAARKGSPLLVGVGEGEYFVASDVSAILAHTRHVVYLEDGEMAVVTRDGYKHARPRRERDARQARSAASTGTSSRSSAAGSRTSC